MPYLVQSQYDCCQCVDGKSRVVSEEALFVWKVDLEMGAVFVLFASPASLPRDLTGFLPRLLQQRCQKDKSGPL